MTSSLGAQASFDLANAAASVQQQPHHNTHHGQGMLFSQTGAASGANHQSNHHMNQLTSPAKPLNQLQGSQQTNGVKAANPQNQSSQMVV